MNVRMYLCFMNQDGSDTLGASCQVPMVCGREGITQIQAEFHCSPVGPLSIIEIKLLL